MEVPSDQLERFALAQVLEYLRIKEVVERLPHVGNGIEMQRRGSDEEATVIVHEEFSQGGDVLPIPDLAGEDRVEVLQHDEDRAFLSPVLLAQSWCQCVDYDRIVPFGLQSVVKFEPDRLVGQDVAQDLAQPEQKICKRERSMGLFGEASDNVL